jgi:hypothetical protein
MGQGEHKVRDLIVYFIVAFALILLMSSFVLGDVYKSASQIELTPSGIQHVYQVNIGDRTLSNLNQQ